jgi:hypothetical protein
MALAPLASAAHLQVKGVDISNSILVTLMLETASEVIRDAAGSTISREISTVTVPAPEGRWLELPGPVISVDSVTIDGEADADWVLVGGMLWRPCNWMLCDPVNVEVTYTHGLAVVPADIVNLCVDLAKAGIEAAAKESVPANVVAVSGAIDDYNERTQYSETARTVMELPEVTRAWLAKRFGGGVYVTGERK